MSAPRRDPDMEKEPEEVKRGRQFAEVRDHHWTPEPIDREAANARLVVLGVGHLATPRPEQETEPEMLERSIFGESRIDEDHRLAGLDR